jgi:tetratricopeptide (TPR) repeat protein
MKRIIGMMALLLLAIEPASARGIHYGAVTDKALMACDLQQWRGQREAATRCYKALFSSIKELGIRAEIAWALGDIKTANELFGAAIKQRSTPALLTRWGELYAEKHQNDEALKLYQEALQLDSAFAFAQVGAASVLVYQYAAQANEYLQPVIEGKQVPAGAKLRALLLAARVNLEDSDTARATELLNEATQVATEAKLPQLEIYALQASVELLRSPLGTQVTQSAWVKKALEENPAYGDIYAIPAHFYVITRRTREAVELFKRAVEIQPDNWEARVEYGSSLLRDNQIAAAREQMEAAYKGDPYNVVTVNTLRLLDSLKDYDVLAYPDITEQKNSTARVQQDQVPMVLRLHKKESAVLGPYVRKLTEQAIATYSSQFNFKLKEPVVIELYPNHEDFAVRTAGEPGLGLLGVTFGHVVAMDSPSSRATDEFHWGTTLWHELAHVFTLESTEHRVPRWFSEGISVYEEWTSGPVKGVSIPADVYAAFKAGKALPVAELDRGFIRPDSPQQVMVSYMQAGLICQFIAREFGAAKFNDMLSAFKQGMDTTQVVQTVLQIEPKAFDARFNVFVQQQFKTLFEKFDDWENARSVMIAAYERSDWSAVIESAQVALTILPNDIEQGSPYVALARAYNSTQKEAQAQSTLQTYFRLGGHDADALRWLAARLREQKKDSEAAQVLEAINYVTPFNYEVHGELGDTLLTLKRPVEALGEFQVALKLNPPDRAAAYYRIAQALQMAQRHTEAKKNVLLALEIAPNFRPAQQLLLELVKTK